MSFGRIVLIAIAVLVVYGTVKNFGVILMFFAMRSYGKGDKPRAIKGLERALDFPMPPSPKLTCAYVLLKEGRLEKAEEVFSALRSVSSKRFNPKEVSVHFSLIYWKRGELDRAVECLEDLLADGYRTSVLYANLGYFLIEKGDWDRAWEVNTAGLEYDSTSMVLRDNLALIHIKREEWDEAAAIYDTLLPELPGFPDPYYNRALVHIHCQEWDRAKDLLIRAEGKNFTFLSTLSREQVEGKLKELEALTGGEDS
ncbi:MAG: tetratricopeptide repeat protein [Spirochaetales bacterium]|nr:tetratricopeptide repeat protein [Spirochaetales bacterium]